MLRSYTLSTLIERYSVEEILPEETKGNKLLVFLLRHGYIDENYGEESFAKIRKNGGRRCATGIAGNWFKP